MAAKSVQPSDGKINSENAQTHILDLAMQLKLSLNAHNKIASQKGLQNLFPSVWDSGLTKCSTKLQSRPFIRPRTWKTIWTVSRIFQTTSNDTFPEWDNWTSTSKVNWFDSLVFVQLLHAYFPILAILRDIEHYSDVIQRGPEAQESQVDSGDEKPSGSGLTTPSGGNAGHWRKRLLQKVQSALISSLEIGDEKLQLVQTMQDVVENKSRQLETDCKALGKFGIMWCFNIKFKYNLCVEFSKDRESADCAKDNSSNNRETGSASGGNAANTGERTKRARRARPDVSYN